jgi:hypothetical protein
VCPYRSRRWCGFSVLHTVLIQHVSWSWFWRHHFNSTFNQLPSLLLRPLSFSILGREFRSTSITPSTSGLGCYRLKWLLTNKRLVLLAISNNGGRSFLKYSPEVQSGSNNTSRRILTIPLVKLVGHARRTARIARPGRGHARSQNDVGLTCLKFMNKLQQAVT